MFLLTSVEDLESVLNKLMCGICRSVSLCFGVVHCSFKGRITVCLGRNLRRVRVVCLSFGVSYCIRQEVGKCSFAVVFGGFRMKLVLALRFSLVN